MKIVKFTFFLLFLFIALGTEASASAEEEAWEDFSSLYGESVTPTELSDSVGIEALLSEVFASVLENKGSLAKFFSTVMLAVLLISFCEFSTFLEGRKYGAHVSAAVTTLSSVMIFSSLYPALGALKEGLCEIGGFFGALIPILTGISYAAGSTASASAATVNMNITLSILSAVSLKLLLPLAAISFSLTLADGFSQGAVGSLVKSIKGAFSWILGILTAVIIGGVSMQSVISAATDSAAIRAARICAADIIPVVGSTVSSSLSTLVGGLSYVKDAVGVGSVIFIVGAACAPLIMMLLYRFCISFGIAIMDFIGITGGVRAFSAFRSAMDSLIAVFSVSILIYVFEIIIFMKCGVASFG